MNVRKYKILYYDCLTPILLFMHAMRALGQKVEEARNLMNKFIEEKVKEYKDLKDQGKLYEAYKKLGEAMHPIMDSTSPLHEGFQVWPGLNAPRYGEKQNRFSNLIPIMKESKWIY